jgi:16S rRNA (cytosine967-C5)-methyltransferase
VNRRRAERAACIGELEAAGCAVRASRLSPVGIAIEDGSPYACAAFSEGRITPQAEGSQLVGLLLAPQPGESVLDACAGSGGKSAHLAELMDDAGLVVAMDRQARGFRRLRRECARLGLASVRPVAGDAAEPPFRSSRAFARVLVDAPCSGLGTLREHPEIRWRRQPADLERFAEVQRRLLSRALELVRPGGWVVYATCTIARAENEGVVGAVLEEAGVGARIVDARTALPPSAHEAVDEATGVLRTLPHRHGTGGFYGALLKRL